MVNERKNAQSAKVVEMHENNKGKRLKIGGILVIIFMLLYVPSLLHWLSNDNIGSDVLRYGLIEESITTEAILVRDEVLLDPATKDGQIIPDAKEGERIPAFYTVATISDNTSKSLLKQLDEVNNKIIEAQNEKARKVDFFSEDMAKIDDNIGLKIEDIIWESRNNSLVNLSQLKTEVDKLIEKKATIAGEDNKDPIMNSLKQKRNQLQQQIKSNTSQVTSKYSGIISYVIDGYENVLKTKSLDKITPELYNKIMDKSKAGKTEYGNMEAGKPFIKVIKGNTYTIATLIDKQKAVAYKAGDPINVRINDIGAVVPGKIAGVYPKSSNEYLLAVTLDRYSEQLSTFRKVNVDLIKKSQEGLKVPLKCLFSPDKKWEKAKIMLIKANCAAERDVLVLCKDEEYAIIMSPEEEVKNKVSLYDIYILNPENVEEGQIILK